jgi:hypothetical protein
VERESKSFEHAITFTPFGTQKGTRCLENIPTGEVCLTLPQNRVVRMLNYEGRLKSSRTRLITPRQNFVEVRWLSLFRSTSLGKRCTSYNAPPTSRKRAADRWSLRNFLPQSSIFMVGLAQKSHGARSGLYGGCSNGVAPISVSASITTLQSCNTDAPLRLLRHSKKCSFKTTVTLTMVRGMKITPLLRYPHHYNLA